MDAELGRSGQRLEAAFTRLARFREVARLPPQRYRVEAQARVISLTRRGDIQFGTVPETFKIGGDFGARNMQ